MSDEAILQALDKNLMKFIKAEMNKIEEHQLPMLATVMLEKACQLFQVLDGKEKAAEIIYSFADRYATK
jgi:succinate dehydrogenase flavin-adding protein (antitoxin of CptAB toxin-antitoxin module)